MSELTVCGRVSVISVVEWNVIPEVKNFVIEN